MEIFKVTPCSRKPGRFDVKVNGMYERFLDHVLDRGDVEILSRTPYLAVFEKDGERYAVEKHRGKEEGFTVTVSAETKDGARETVTGLPREIDVNLKE